MTLTSARYCGVTASVQADPEATHQRERASESYRLDFPIDVARCATFPTDQDWVPDVEAPRVPRLLAAVCRSCPGREACLAWATATDAHGYWAGTTHRERLALDGNGVELFAAAEALITAHEDEDAALRRHPKGEGSFRYYRGRGCRCSECRAANAEHRGQERARKRAGLASAA